MNRTVDFQKFKQGVMKKLTGVVACLQKMIKLTSFMA